MNNNEVLKPQEKASEEKNLLLEKKKTLSEEQTEQNVLDRFYRIKWEMKLPEVLVDRFKLLERNSFINEYSQMVSNGAGNILTRIYADKKEELPEWKLLITKLAALIHDIGKSGPVKAKPEQQLAVVKVFAIENSGIGGSSVESIVQEKLENANDIILKLKECGIDTSMSMREFWDMHAVWGYTVLKEHKDSLPLEAIKIAGMHHAHKDLNSPIHNPLIDEISTDEIITPEMMARASLLGILEEYLLVVVFDNYEAFVHREGLKPKEAIEAVGARIPKKFKDDYPLIDEILNKMENMSDVEIAKIFEEKKDNI